MWQTDLTQHGSHQVERWRHHRVLEVGRWVQHVNQLQQQHLKPSNPPAHIVNTYPPSNPSLTHIHPATHQHTSSTPIHPATHQHTSTPIHPSTPTHPPTHQHTSSIPIHPAHIVNTYPPSNPQHPSSTPIHPATHHQHLSIQQPISTHGQHLSTQQPINIHHQHLSTQQPIINTYPSTQQPISTHGQHLSTHSQQTQYSFTHKHWNKNTNSKNTMILFCFAPAWISYTWLSPGRGPTSTSKTPPRSNPHFPSP